VGEQQRLYFFVGIVLGRRRISVIKTRLSLFEEAMPEWRVLEIGGGGGIIADTGFNLFALTVFVYYSWML
jgi:hypothetical protein